MRRRLTCVLAGAALLALAAPAAAFAHAALLRTSPSASGILAKPPEAVTLTYTEPVEPRFAIVSVTDAGGHQVTRGGPRRGAQADQLTVPLRRVPQGWYLVYWRVVSQDGHPVRGAFTFAVGPNPGPAPQFVIPSITESAAKPRLVVARWVTFLAAMVSVGLLVFRILIARPLTVVAPGATQRWVTVALASALLVALVATPIYLDLATAQFALRPWTALGDLVPLMRASAFGRAFLDFELVMALFALTCVAAVLVERPHRKARSVAELLTVAASVATGIAALFVLSLAGHAATTSPRGVSLLLDVAHLTAGSIWLGGLIGLLVLWSSVGRVRRTAALGNLVPRFSKTAFVSVMALIGTGVGASVLHMPTISAFWQTTYGKVLVIKIVLLGLTMLIAAVNLLRTTPRLQAAVTRKDENLGVGAATLLRRLVRGETLIVAGALFAAAALSSLPPPSKALAEIGRASARVGPGPVAKTVKKEGYDLKFFVNPNRAALTNDFAIDIARGGHPVTGAEVSTHFAMLDMEMQQFGYTFPEVSPGHYVRRAPALVMVGHWAFRVAIAPPDAKPFEVVVVDTARG